MRVFKKIKVKVAKIRIYVLETTLFTKILSGYV